MSKIKIRDFVRLDHPKYGKFANMSLSILQEEEGHKYLADFSIEVIGDEIYIVIDDESIVLNDDLCDSPEDADDFFKDCPF